MLCYSITLYVISIIIIIIIMIMNIIMIIIMIITMHDTMAKHHDTYSCSTYLKSMLFRSSGMWCLIIVDVTLSYNYSLPNMG